jgi:5'-nucleotidase
MTNTSILLTNDDGLDSPLFIPFAKEIALHFDGQEPKVVAPASEQSWIGQAMSRHQPVFVEEIDENTRKVQGTPADCVDLGIHSLFDSTADFVVSGINIGTNAGLAFYLNSGTLGAAKQAFLAGVRAIGVSLNVPLEVFNAWGKHDSELLSSFEPQFDAACKRAALLCRQLCESEVWDGVDLFSINLPWELNLETKTIVTRVERNSYGPLFEESGDGRYVHSLRQLPTPNSELKEGELPGDWQTLFRGDISVTPISYDLSPRKPETSDRIRQALSIS